MKKFVILVIFLLVTSGSQVMADPGDHLHLPWLQQVNPSQCDHVGRPVINVVGKVANDVDSGIGGNNWAFDTFVRHIQVWLQTDGSYCVLVQMVGVFDAQAGQTSPGAGGVLNGTEDGIFDGGYRGVVWGTLKSSPAWATRGGLATVNYQCDIGGNCPGYVSWLGQYFEPGYNFDYAWWGWIYHAGRKGTWINAIDGNQGDIFAH